MELIWYRDWLFVGHDCEITRPGSYFTVQVGDYPVVVVRGRDGVIRALHNTCRHRGSRVCAEQKGMAARLVCPYHQWTYDLDGSLVFARQMGEDLCKQDLGLKPVACESVAGYVFLRRRSRRAFRPDRASDGAGGGGEDRGGLRIRPLRHLQGDEDGGRGRDEPQWRHPRRRNRPGLHPRLLLAPAVGARCRGLTMGSVARPAALLDRDHPSEPSRLSAQVSPEDVFLLWLLRLPEGADIVEAPATRSRGLTGSRPWRRGPLACAR